MPQRDTERFTWDMTGEERKLLNSLRKNVKAATSVEALRYLLRKSAPLAKQERSVAAEVRLLRLAVERYCKLQLDMQQQFQVALVKVLGKAIGGMPMLVEEAASLVSPKHQQGSTS